MSSENSNGQPQHDGSSEEQVATPAQSATEVPAPPTQPGSPFSDIQASLPVPPPSKRGFPAWAWWLIGGGVALIALIIVAVVLVFADFSGRGPQSVAEDYVNSLNNGDSERANELARVVDTDKRLVVLASDALAEAEGATDFKIERFQHHDDRAMVEISYLIDGSKLTDYAEITRDGDGWYVATGLTHRLPTVYSDGVEGYRIPGYDGIIGSDLDLQAYPGTYTLLPPSDLFELASEVTFEVGASTSYAAPDPEYVPTQKYLDEVNDAIKMHIDTCLGSLGGSDIYSLSSCGITAYQNEIVGVASVKVEIVEYPTSGISSSYGWVEIENIGAVTVVIAGSMIGGGEGTESVDGDFRNLYFNATVSGDTVDVEFY